MCSFSMACAVLGLFLCCSSVLTFNVDTASRVIHRGTPNSMFGFTVQVHAHGSDKMLLVGAPEDDPGRRADLVRPGSVYRCYPDRPGGCREIIFDEKGNRVDMQNRQIDQKSHQWFGATLTSTGVDGPIVACAPRYVYFVSAKLGQRDPVGSCYVAKTPEGRSAKEFSPCRLNSHGQRKTGVCQAGFGAAISKDGNKLFLGAPGSWYWQGRTFAIVANETFSYFTPKISEEGQLYTQDTQTPSLLATKEASPIYDDSYMGYSLAVGDFGGRGVQAVAVGVPRGSNLRGLVVLYSWNLEVIRNISGSQIGAYFGYCLASGDVDGDGYDDVIIGAPMFSRPNSDGYEHGRVYVVYQGKDGSYNRNQHRTGEVSKGRFGLAVTSLGDINLDGFGDIAVGAPYSGKNGQGMVFIYHGSSQGLGEKYTQAIAAEEVDPMMTTFGFSLSGGVDLDSNNYTDLAVGAYKSDSVVFFRSRPVIKVTAKVEFHDSRSKLISLDDKSCTLRNGTKLACAHLRYCLKYDAEYVYSQMEFKVIIDLDSRQTRSKRMFLEERLTRYTHKIYLTRGILECGNTTVYLVEDIRDKLTPLEVAMTYELVTQRAPGIIPPILDQTVINVHTDSLNIQKNCGSDNICIPDLIMAVTTPTTNYLLGSDEKVMFNVDVQNAGEDAFEAAYFLHIPQGVSYNKMKRLDEDGEHLPVYCSASGRHALGNSVLRCDMGNPLPSGKQVKFQILLEVDASVTSLEFDMEANSTNPERGTSFDNKRHLSISVLVEARLAVIGTSDPPELHYNSSLYDGGELDKDTKMGPQVIHKYNIKNDGPFAVEQAELYILWPYQTLSGENLMYMLVQPQTVGPLSCDFASHVNPLSLFVQTPYNFFLLKELEAYRHSEFSSSSSAGGRTNDGQVIDYGSLQEGSQVTSSYNYSRNSESSGSGHGLRNEERTYTGNSYSSQTGSTQNGGSSENRFQQNHVSSSQNGNGYGQNGNAYGHQGTSRTFVSGVYNEGQNHGQYGTTVHGQVGNGITRQWNKTVLYDEAGHIISETETSTEFGSLGHEGEAGSSFSRYGSSGAQNQGYHGSSNQQRGYNQNGQAHWTHGFDASATNNDQRHSWSTEETVNRDIMTAGSRNSQRGGFSQSNERTGSSAGLTVVGDEEDELSGFAANAALNPSNEFRTGFADVNVGASSQGNRGGSSFETRGSSGAYGSGSGGGMQGQSYARSGSNEGSYSYSSSSGSSQSGGSQYSYGSQASGSSGVTTQYRRDNTRKRRQAEIPIELREMIDKCEEKFKCEVIRCQTGYLAKGQEVWVALRGRFNASVLNEITKDRAVTLSTMAATRVTQLPMVGTPKQASWQKAEAQTVITQQLEALSSGSIPLWVVVLAAVVGALLLLLLIFALYKCGFFNRNRPSDHAERQPLNGRDEHL